MKTNESTTMRIKKDVHALAKKAAEKDGRYLEIFVERAITAAAEKVLDRVSEKKK